MDLSRKRRFGGLAALCAVWVAVLGAGTAHAKKQDKPTACRLRCERIEQAAQEEVNQCVRQCPKARRGQMDAYLVCTEGCNKKLKDKPRGIACLDSCESGELDKPKKKDKVSKSNRQKSSSKGGPKIIRVRRR